MSTSLLWRVYETLRGTGIPSALIGAAALAVYGVSRSTLDQDLLVTDRRALDRSTWSGLAASVEIRIGDADDPLAGVVRITAAGERDVDVVVGRQGWQHDAITTAVLTDHPSGHIPVATPQALVLLKLYAGGAQDLWDIQQLRAAQGPPLDHAVSAALEPLGRDLRERWHRLTEG